MKNKQLVINMLSSILSFIVTMGISFFLTPFIVEKLGREAYGFIGLINNLISYVSIVTIALNSMAGRFITLKIHQEDNEGANIYFNSVLVGNIIISIILLCTSLILLLNIENILDIPKKFNTDVKIAFILVSIEFIINLIYSIYGIATFVTNKLYIVSVRTIQSNILKIVVLVGLFLFLSPRIFYVNIATIIMTIFIVITNVHYTKKLLPQIHINKKYFKLDSVLELIISGIWNVFNKLSQLLNTGLDLLLANIFLGASLMGSLSISKTIPNCFISFTISIVNVFAPDLTIYYAKNNKEKLVQTIENSIKIMTIFTSLFFAFIVVYSEDFYKLWMPSQESELLYKLTLLAVFHMPVTSGMNCIYSIFTVTNKLKKVSLVLLCNSILNATIIIISCMLLPNSISIYIISGTSSLLALLVMLYFSIPYAAKSLNLKVTTFYPNLITCVISNVFMILIFYLCRYFIKVDGWIELIFACFISAILGLILNIFIILSGEERKNLINKLKARRK